MVSRFITHNLLVDLSKKFLSLPCGKMLMLASTDRLDNELMVGQMQGKFQIVLFSETGHNIHEDASLKVAESLAEFLKWNAPLIVKKFDIPLNPKSHATSPL
jgi:protein phosphatase methylesterase 1